MWAKVKKVILVNGVTVPLAMVFAWITTATNSGGSNDPDWFAFMAGFVSIAFLLGGIVLSCVLWAEHDDYA